MHGFVQMGEKACAEKRVPAQGEEVIMDTDLFELQRLGPDFGQHLLDRRAWRDEGLVHEIKFGDGASRYDRETDRHDHAICSKCGKLVDFDLPGTVALTRAAARASKFQAESIHLTLVGLCPNCRE